jgi:hypothetical protein
MAASEPAVEMAIVSRVRDLEGFEVRRVLPFGKRRTVGPFIFLDQIGPAELLIHRNLEVRAHPHIGLATVTYLFSGALTHRDSLGNRQPIRPGEVNWMTAGRGIVHSERSSDAGNAPGARLFGVQTWVALRREREERAPAFAHHDASELPRIDDAGVAGRLVLGEAWGLRSPVAAESDPFYAELRLDAGARLQLPSRVEERGVYVLAGRLRADGQPFESGQLVVLRPGAEVVIEADGPLHALALGGPSLDGARFIWWNFVSSSRERIEQAKADWREQRFDAVPGESEFVPLPEERP